MQKLSHAIPVLCLILLLCLSFACTEDSKENPLELSSFKSYAGDRPQLLTKIRPDFLSEFGRYAHSLDAISLKSQQTSLKKLATEIEQIGTLTVSVDSVQELQLEAERWFVQQKIAGQEFLLYQNPLNPFTGFHSKLMESLKLQLIQNKEDTENYNARLKQIPWQIQQVAILLQQRDSAGIYSHPLILAEAEKEIRKFVETPIDQHFIYRNLAIKLNGVGPTEMNLYEAGDYLETTSINLEKNVIPAYKKLLELIQELIARATSKTSFTSIKQGENYSAYYDWKLNSSSGKEVKAADLFEKGHHELDSLQQLLAKIDEQIAKQGIKRKAKEKRKRNRLEQVQIFAARMRKAREETLSLFDSLPQKSPEIMPLPKQFEQEEPLFYQAPSWDNARKARIIVNFESWDQASIYEQHADLYRKLYPGSHSMQSLSKTQNFLLSAESFPAWQLGWQEYVMRLAQEPLYLFAEKLWTQRDYQAERLKVLLKYLLDIGIHHKGWTTEEAIDFLKKHQSLSETEIEKALLETYSEPGRLTASWIGAEAFQKLYKQGLQKANGKFNYKTFHQTCFNHGPLPWNLFQRLIGA
ncbi:MAG: DUF885 family protein [Bacteroidota bacterium]